MYVGVHVQGSQVILGGARKKQGCTKKDSLVFGMRVLHLPDFLSNMIVRSRKLVFVERSSVFHFSLLCPFRQDLNKLKSFGALGRSFQIKRMSSMKRKYRIILASNLLSISVLSNHPKNIVAYAQAHDVPIAVPINCFHHVSPNLKNVIGHHPLQEFDD